MSKPLILSQSFLEPTGSTQAIQFHSFIKSTLDKEKTPIMCEILFLAQTKRKKETKLESTRVKIM